MAKKKKQSIPRDLIYIIIIAVLVIALLVSLFAGDKLGFLMKSDETETNNQQYATSTLTYEPTLWSCESGSSLEIHFIDIGQGDAIAIKFPDGKNMLIDAGSGTSASKAIKTKYLDYLDSMGLSSGSTIDYLVVTHPDADHVNMMSEVIDKYDVDNLYYNDYSYHPKISATYTTFMDKATKEVGANNYKVGESNASYNISGSGYSVDIYAPGYGTFAEEAVEGTNKNILSLMCVLSYGGRKVMFTGDAEVPTEKWFMETVGASSLDVDVLKVGHHGSYSCTSTDFLDFITPEYCLISCDNGQAYHHPHPETMNTLFDYGIVTYRTNRHGNTVLMIASDGKFGFLPEKYVQVENNTKNRDPLTIKLK